LGLVEAAEAAQILAKQVIGAAHIARHFSGVGNEMDVLFKGFDGLGEALRFAIDFAKIEIREGFLATEPAGVKESGFGRRKITQRDIGDTQEQKCVVIVGMKLQLTLEFDTGLWIGFFPRNSRRE